MSSNLLQTLTTIVFLLITTPTISARRLMANDPCSVSDFPDVCKSVVKGATDGKSATEVAITDLVKKTKEASTGPVKGDEVCKASYESAVSNLEKALGNMKTNDAASLSTNLSATLTDFVTCGDSMEGSPPTDPIIVTTLSLKKMADNALALSTLVVKQ